MPQPNESLMSYLNDSSVQSLIDSIGDDTQLNGYLRVEDELSVDESLLSSPLTEGEETLIGESNDVASFIKLNNEVLSEHEIQKRKAFFGNPKNQAQILLDDYVKHQDILVNHSQRRKVYAHFLREAKKGKYKKLFAEYIYGNAEVSR